jgi:hypothetical protein
LDPGSCRIVPRQRDPSSLCSGGRADFDVFAAAGCEGAALAIAKKPLRKSECCAIESFAEVGEF